MTERLKQNDHRDMSRCKSRCLNVCNRLQTTNSISFKCTTNTRSSGRHKYNQTNCYKPAKVTLMPSHIGETEARRTNCNSILSSHRTPSKSATPPNQALNPIQDHAIRHNEHLGLKLADKPTVSRLTSGSLQLTNRRRASAVSQLVTFIVLNHILFGHLNYNINSQQPQTQQTGLESLSSALLNVLPKIQPVGALECSSDSECPPDKSCYDNKCTCPKAQPVEDGDRCFQLALYGESCQLNEQCLGFSTCDRGYCACGLDQVDVFNPSSKIVYCHDKRGLNEPCSHDLQCPSNSYCSTKSGCLCQNGFGPARVNVGQGETLQCLAKTCRTSAQCESEYHACEEDKCKCLATHFDPETARCYKFAATKAASGELGADQNGTLESVDEPKTGGGLGGFLKDLIDTRDNNNLWLLVLILALLSLLVFGIIFLLIRRHQLGHWGCCCWTANKKAEYEPNTSGSAAKAAAATGNGFDKNSVSQKSFRRKSPADLEEGHSASSEELDDNSYLVSGNKNGAGSGLSTSRSSFATPLKTSTSTPV